jgi:flagellin
MSSILTNTAAMTALKNLMSINNQLTATQNRISTGLKVSSAQDNAAYWSISTTMKSDESSIKTVNDSLSLGSSAIDVAYNGTNQALTIAQKIKDDLTSATAQGVDRTKIQADITQLQSQLKSIADSSSFSGKNILSVDSSAANTSYNATMSIVSSYTRGATGITIGTIDVSVTSSKLFDSNGAAGILDKTFAAGTGTTAVSTLDISALTDSATDQATLTQMINGVDAAISKMTTSAANLGAAQTRISSQQSFIQSLTDSIDKGVGALVDADMTTESTKLQALQVQQQLATQALSIANQSSSAILSLFK